MFYRKSINGLYDVLASKLDDNCIEMDDDLFEACYDGIRLKGDTTGRDENFQDGQFLYDANHEMYELKKYLVDTDYVIIKLNELKLDNGDQYETEKAKYSSILQKRKEVRTRINELTTKIEALQ